MWILDSARDLCVTLEVHSRAAPRGCARRQTGVLGHVAPDVVESELGAILACRVPLRLDGISRCRAI
jgi:hypothetical protein